jgi:hypothetical protein
MGESYSKSHPTSIATVASGVITGLNTLSSQDPYTYTTSSFGSFKWTDSFSGEPNPNWRAQIRSGSNATTPASGYRFTADIEEFHAHSRIQRIDIPNQTIYEVQDSGGSLLPNIQANGSAPSDIVTSVHNRLIARFIDHVEEAQSSFQAGQDLGEWKQTRDAIIRPLSSLQDHVLGYFDKLKKVRRNMARSSGSRRKIGIAKALNDAYLEWTFGWNPIVSDIAHAQVALENLKTHPSVVPVNASSYQIYSASDSEEQIPTGPSNLTIRFTRQVYSKYSERIKAAVRCSPDDSTPSIVDALQLAPEDFLPTAWNLLPYSFVVDYFVNVGDIINAYAFRIADLTWGNWTSRTEIATNYGNLGLVDPGLNPSQYTRTAFAFGGNSKFLHKSFQRSKLTPDLLIPSLTFSLPMGSEKPWLNMASLIFSRVSRLVPFL